MTYAVELEVLQQHQFFFFFFKACKMRYKSMGVNVKDGLFSCTHLSGFRRLINSRKEMILLVLKVSKVMISGVGGGWSTRYIKDKDW